ncbi:hypothetical protein Tco_1571583 [Tanacetum coccineum]
MMGHAGFADSKVAIEPSDLVDMAALMKGLCLINCADSFVEISVSARGSKSLKMTTAVVNNSLFRSLFEKQKFSGIYFMEWNLQIVLSTEDKLPFLEQPIPTLRIPPEGQANPPDVVTTHQAWI